MSEHQDSSPSATNEKALPTPSRAEAILTALQALWSRIHWRKVAIFIISLFLFILAINMMKEGAQGLGPLVRDTLAVDNPINSMGFGWLFAYTVMSGSPVAAVALTFFATGIVDKLGAFTMITGSRLGASFIVLFIGFLYVLRGKDRATSLSMGLLSLSVTGTTYLVGLFVGLILLSSGVLDSVQLQSGVVLSSLTDLVFDPIVSFISGIFPGVLLFLVGLGIIILSLNFFDKALPQMAIKESQVGQVSRLVYRPWVMFLMGAFITMISMSVSVSLGILVPLSNRGFIRRENVIPYIMGANITTFVDTLLAAVLLNNPPAFTVVLVEMLSITIVSIVLLVTFFHRYERMMLTFVDQVTARDRNLIIFMVSILVVPLILMFF